VTGCWRPNGPVHTLLVMTEPEEKPRSAPARMTGDAKEERTPPARPDERGSEGSRARRIAERAPERETSADERSQGTAAEAPEEIAGGAVHQDPDVDRALD
jgi:hypothetical protein